MTAITAGSLDRIQGNRLLTLAFKKQTNGCYVPSRPRFGNTSVAGYFASKFGLRDAILPVHVIMITALIVDCKRHAAVRYFRHRNRPITDLHFMSVAMH